MAETAPAGRRPAPATIALALAALIAVAALSYTIFFRNRGEAPAATGNASAANAAAEPSEAQLVASVEARIADLVESLRRDPDNHAGWFELGGAYRTIERFPDAAQAFRRAMELQPRNGDYTAVLAETLLIQSTQARQPPPPEAEQLFRRTLEIQPGDPRSRFYLATIKDMRGDHRGAVDDLIALLRDAPPGETWPQQVRDSIAFIAQRNNIDVSGRLPAAPAAPPQSVATAAIPGPTPEQMRQAGGMTPSQQDAASRAMVARLAARLAANPRDEARWIMLMRSRMVLQDSGGAAEALRSALGAFQNDVATQSRLRQAARELGVPAG